MGTWTLRVMVLVEGSCGAFARVGSLPSKTYRLMLTSKCNVYKACHQAIPGLNSVHDHGLEFCLDYAVMYPDTPLKSLRPYSS